MGEFMLRYKLMVLGYLLFLFFLLSSTKTQAFEFPLMGKVIFVDAGHGGRDPGTYYGKVLEKDINLAIAKKLEHELSVLGATVYLTRETDEDLSSIYDARKKRGDLYRRILMISDKEKKADLYLSIHINWYDNSYWSGAEVLYHPINSKNKGLANFIMESLKIGTNTKRTIKKTNLYMYKNLLVPGVLIECGFLSNSKERNLLQQEEYQEKLAIYITKGVINYFDAN